MNLICQYTLDDYQKAFRSHYQHGGGWNILRLRGAVVVGCLLALFGLWMLVKWPSHPSLFLPLLLLAAAWIAIGSGVIRRRFARIQFLRNPSLRQEYKFGITDEGIRFDYGIGRTEMGWQAFTRYVESDDAFLLYRSPHQ